MDYELEAKFLADALREAQGQRALRMPEAKMQGDYAILPGAGNTLDAGFNRLLGNWQKPRTEQRMRDLSAQEQNEYEGMLTELTTPGTQQIQSYEGEEGPLPEPMTKNVPLGPLEESRRRLGVYGKMSRLPKAAQLAQAGIKSEVDMPERLALQEQRDATAKELQAQRDQERWRADRAREEAKADSDRLYRLTAGTQEELRRAQIAQMGAGQQVKVDAAKAKIDEAKESNQKAADRFGSLADNFSTQIDILDKGMGATSADNRWGSNIGAWASNTAPGQVVGKMFGTDNQAARNKMKLYAGNMLLELKALKNLPAAMMNSNMELQQNLANIAGGDNVDVGTLRESMRLAKELVAANKVGADKAIDSGGAPGAGGAPPAAPPGAPAGATVVKQTLKKHPSNPNQTVVEVTFSDGTTKYYAK